MSDRYSDKELTFLASVKDDEKIEGSIARKLIGEIVELRAMVKRLEAWAKELLGGSFGDALGPMIAAELRKRMGGDHG